MPLHRHERCGNGSPSRQTRRISPRRNSLSRSGARRTHAARTARLHSRLDRWRSSRRISRGNLLFRHRFANPMRLRFTANDIREHAGGRDIHFFVSNDKCGPSRGCVFPNPAPKPSGSGVAFAEAWQFAQSPRRPEMTASCRQTYAQDGNCYPSGMSPTSGLYVDVNTANSPDPSQARTR